MKQSQDIHELCKDIKLKHTFYQSTEYYSMGKYLRNYGYYPKWLPLFVSTDHGPTQRDVPTYSDLKKDSPHMLVHSKRLAAKWKELSKIPCDVMMSPFVFYRRSHNINKSETASGTLAFPAHTTDFIENDTDFEVYATSLLSLPPEFQPVSVCLYYLDVRKGKHRIFEKLNIPVYTAGHIYDTRFMERFYAILRNFAFTTSNHLGSYVFYAVEMGIPFFIQGKSPIMINKGGLSSPDGAYDPLKLSVQLNKATALFGDSARNITTEQRELVEAELGIHDGVSRFRMAAILYGSLLRWLFSKRPVRHLWNRRYHAIPSFLIHKYQIIRSGLVEEAKIATRLTSDEKLTLYRLAKNLGPQAVAVEIGSNLGAGSCFIAKGLLSNKGEIFCVDTWQNQSISNDGMNSFNTFLANTEKYRTMIMPLKGTSQAVVNEFAKMDKKIHLLFIDGDHSYEACKGDWDAFSPFLNQNSLVVLHGTGQSNGVNKVIGECILSRTIKIMDLPNMQVYKVITP
jgi:Methyltransferase domain